jgi:hypothetical protein
VPRWGESFKNLTSPVKRNVSRQLSKTQNESKSCFLEFWQLIQVLDVNNVVFVDETGVNIAMTRLYARALKGTRAFGSRRQSVQIRLLG